jgi:lysophospholipase L1-like esterase
MPRIRSALLRSLSVLLSFLLPLAPALAQSVSPVNAPWTASWATSAQSSGDSQPSAETTDLADRTVRQVVRLSAGGTQLRVTFSNAFGTQPLLIDAAAIASTAPDLSSIQPGSSHPLTFSGQPSVLIPIGAEFVSDPVTMPSTPLGNLTVTYHLPSAPQGQTVHPGSRATSFLVAGNHVSDPALPNAEKVVRWMQISEVDVTGPANRTVVALGDSITDGHGATTDGNDRWTDIFAAHLQAAGVKQVGVANEGIGGNHMLTNGIGQSALERFDRDVLAVAGVRYVLLFEGINDLGALSRAGNGTPEQHANLVARIEAGYTQLIERAHAHGIKVYGATITPDTGSGYYHPTPTDDADRRAINDWIRQPGHFDAFVDFDAIVRDPAHPEQLLPAFDCGDHLHPSPAGYKAMGNAVPLSWFQ